MVSLRAQWMFGDSLVKRLAYLAREFSGEIKNTISESWSDLHNRPCSLRISLANLGEPSRKRGVVLLQFLHICVVLLDRDL